MNLYTKYNKKFDKPKARAKLIIPWYIILIIGIVISQFHGMKEMGMCISVPAATGGILSSWFIIKYDMDKFEYDLTNRYK